MDRAVRKFLSEIGKRGGSSKSAAKRLAAKRNAKKATAARWGAR
jgi:hypothetical protein